MISEDKLFFVDNRAADSDESVPSYMKFSKFHNSHSDCDRKFFTFLPACYEMIVLH